MKLKLDSFGAVVRYYRQKQEKTLRQMARDLDISPAALSAIEVANKKVSPDLDEKIISYLELSKAKKANLEKLAAKRGREMRVSLKNASSFTKELAAMFARTFDDLQDEDAQKIYRVLAAINRQRKTK